MKYIAIAILFFNSIYINNLYGQLQEQTKWKGFFDATSFNQNTEEKSEELLKNYTVFSSEDMIKALSNKEGKKAKIPQVPLRKKAIDKSEVFKLIKPSFVTFSEAFNCGDCQRTHVEPMASGYIISEDGYIVTNYHVLESYKATDKGSMLGMVVFTSDGDVFAVREVVATYKDADLAIVKVDTKGKKLIPLPLGETAEEGDDIYIISHPFPAMNYFSTGYVTRNYLGAVSEENATLLPNTDVSADYAGGSSGAPIVDRYGNLVSTVCATHTINESEETKKTQMVLKITKPVVLLKELITFP